MKEENKIPVQFLIYYNGINNYYLQMNAFIIWYETKNQVLFLANAISSRMHINKNVCNN